MSGGRVEPIRGVRAGPFELLALIGRGGMGEVWEARHVGQDVRVAVKLLTSELAQRPRVMQHFHDEVRSIAALDHPNIAAILDCGELQVDEAAPGKRYFAGGTPYLAMELADHGTVATMGVLPWASLRSVLLALLDALAHAHARDVLHRDIKPGNVLVSDITGAIPVVKLADFGIARRMRDDEVATASGTPAYAAPEQLEGLARDEGPWTDLFALAGLAYRLVTGRVPFPHRTSENRMWASPPQLPEAAGCPKAFQAWLDRSLDPDPLQRFEFAAEAAVALEAIRGPSRRVKDKAETESGGPTPVLAPRTETPLQSGPTGRRPVLGRRPPGSRRGASRGAAPIPGDWRRGAEPGRHWLPAAGLALYDVRAVPLVGREVHRDSLWQALWRVHRDRRAEAILLSGAAGVGKSRLASWLLERAHEVGAAHGVSVMHSTVYGAQDGLGPAIARDLRCAGLSDEQVAERVAVWEGSDAEVSGLVALVTQERAGARFRTPQERYEVLRSYLTRRAGGRAVVVWLDDVQRGHDALSFAAACLARRDDLPVLFVLTVRNEALPERPYEQHLLQRLLAQEGNSPISVAPLVEAEHRELIAALLGLESDLVDRIADRTRGNPLFAVQLVRDWVHRRWLVVGDRGFRLADGVDPVLPDDLFAVWNGRVDRLVAGLPASDEVALELAAVLGQDVESSEWEAVCRHRGVDATPALRSALRAERLVIPLPSGFSFVHGMLRETIERRALKAGRSAAHHSSAADVLGGVRVEDVDRLAHHFVAAGRLVEGLHALLLAAGEYASHESTRVGLAKQRLAEWAVVAKQAGVTQDDEVYWLAEYYGARVEVRLGSREGAIPRLERALVVARERNYARLHVLVATGAGVLIREMSGPVASLDVLREAVAVDPEGAGARNHASAHWMLGMSCAYAGHLDEGLSHLEHAAQLFGQIGEVVRETGVMAQIAYLVHTHGDADRAEVLARAALARATQRRVRFEMGRCNEVLGDILRGKGRLDMARACYQRHIEICRPLGPHEEYVPRVKLAILDGLEGHYLESADALEDLAVLFEKADRRFVAGIVRGIAALPAAGLRDWEGFDRALDEAERTLTERKGTDPDLADALQRAGALAAEVGEEGRAARAREAAAAQWKAMGLPARG